MAYVIINYSEKRQKWPNINCVELLDFQRTFFFRNNIFWLSYYVYSLK